MTLSIRLKKEIIVFIRLMPLITNGRRLSNFYNYNRFVLGGLRLITAFFKITIN
jgi:hypothetical protein